VVLGHVQEWLAWSWWSDYENESSSYPNFVCWPYIQHCSWKL